MENESNEKKLSIVITTYNRKAPLLEQLRSIECQGLFDKYEVIVSDNHSDYDVKDVIRTSLTPEFLKIVTVVQRDFNIGGSMNITMSFTLPKTPWMWLLSDDDITEPDSIRIILKDIEKHKDDDVCWLKYSISGGFKPNIENSFDNLKDLFDYYSGVKRGAGEFIFMSNNVFRLSHLKTYITDLCIFSDTSMSQCILPIFAIKKEKKQICFSSQSITNYTPGRGSWLPVMAYLRFGNILAITALQLNGSEIKAFKKIPFWNEKLLVLSLLSVKDATLRREYLKRIVISHCNLYSFKVIKIVALYMIVSIIGADRVKSMIEKRRNKQ